MQCAGAGQGWDSRLCFSLRQGLREVALPSRLHLQSDEQSSFERLTIEEGSLLHYSFDGTSGDARAERVETTQQLVESTVKVPRMARTEQGQRRWQWLADVAIHGLDLSERPELADSRQIRTVLHTSWVGKSVMPCTTTTFGLIEARLC